MDTLWILLYSKFSPACKEMFFLLQQYSLQNTFKMLDVDSKSIRQRIVEDKKFTIRSVPCIISVSSNGVASQYEGSKAFDVVKVMIQQSLPPDRPPERPDHSLSPSSPPQPQKNQNQPKNTSLMPEENEKPQNITLLSDLIEETNNNNNNNEITAGRQSHSFNGIKKEENQFPNHDRNVSSAIKGEKISVSSVMNQAQQTNDFNPPPRSQPQSQAPEQESTPKKAVEKVNIASIMAATSRN